MLSILINARLFLLGALVILVTLPLKASPRRCRLTVFSEPIKHHHYVDGLVGSAASYFYMGELSRAHRALDQYFQGSHQVFDDSGKSHELKSAFASLLLSQINLRQNKLVDAENYLMVAWVFAKKWREHPFDTDFSEGRAPIWYWYQRKRHEVFELWVRYELALKKGQSDRAEKFYTAWQEEFPKIMASPNYPWDVRSELLVEIESLQNPI